MRLAVTFLILVAAIKANAADCLLGDADNSGTVSLVEVQGCVSNFLGGSQAAGCTGPQGPPGPIGPGVVVKDGNDALVGAVVGDFGAALVGVLLHVDPLPYPVRILVASDSLKGHTDNLLFESGNCTGAAFIHGDSMGVSLVGSSVIIGSVLYYPTASVTAINSNLKSRFDTSTSTCAQVAQTLNVFPTATLDLASRFTAPYRVVTP